MTNQDLALQYITANAHLGSGKEIFDAAQNFSRNRGFLIALAVELIEAAENAANSQKLADHAQYMQTIKIAFDI